MDWVRELHADGEILKAIDPMLDDYNQNEVELVLRLGLLCSHPHPDRRPSMRSVVQVMLGNASLPEIPSNLHLETQDYRSFDRASSSQSTSYTSFAKKIFDSEGIRATS